MSDVLPFRSRPTDPGEIPDPPAHLSEEIVRILWRPLLADWILSPDALVLLRCACESWDTHDGARKVVEREGPTVVNPESGVVRANPAAGIARDALREFRLCLKQIGVPDSDGA